MAKFYKHTNKVDCYQMAAFYDLQQQIKSNDGITKHWAEPQQDAAGDWYLQKPDHLECSAVIECFPGVVIVDGADVTWPEPEEPEITSS